MKDLKVTLAGHVLEYFDDGHAYLVDGVRVPSVTQVIKASFREMYAGVDSDVLKAAAERGTAIHDAIEEFCRSGVIDAKHRAAVYDFKHVFNKAGLEPVEAEVPLIWSRDGAPAAAGRCDHVMRRGDKIVIVDLKTTSSLNTEYATAQLNLYAAAYKQCYGTEVSEIGAIHLHGTRRKYVPLKIIPELPGILFTTYTLLSEDKK